MEQMEHEYEYLGLLRGYELHTLKIEYLLFNAADLIN